MFLLVLDKHLPQLTCGNMHMKHFVAMLKAKQMDLLTGYSFTSRESYIACTYYTKMCLFFHKHLVMSEIFLAFGPTRNITKGQGKQLLKENSCLVFAGLI